MRIRTALFAITCVAGALAGTPPAEAVSGWHVVPTAQPGQNFAYQSRAFDGVVAFGPADVWVGGTYADHSTGGSRPLMLQWTGAGWHRAALPSVAGGASIRFVVSSSRTNIWSIGNASVGAPNIVLFHYNGTSWTRGVNAGLSPNFAVFSAATSGRNDVWLGGYDTAGTPNPVLEHWNGSTWTRMLLPLPAGAAFGQVSGLSFAPGATRPTAVGYSGHGSVFHPYAARFVGGAWHFQTAAATSGEFRSVVMVSATNGWAVGTRYPNTNSYETLIGHWNGTSWTTSSGRDRSGWNTLLDVSAAAANNVWTVGYSQHCPTCADRTLAEHWNGSSWSIAATADPSTSGTDEFAADAVVPGSNQTWAVGTDGPARPANSAEFFLAERNN